MGQIFGRADVVLDGVVLLSKDDSTLDPGGIVRTPVVGNTHHGYQEATTPSKLECTLSIDEKFSLAALDVTNATVNFKADTGQTWVIRGAYRTDAVTLSQKDGAKLVLQGPPAEEVS
jgi:hypothetical protein